MVTAKSADMDNRKSITIIMSMDKADRSPL